MRAFQYLTHVEHDDQPATDEMLNDIGRRGWELVSVAQNKFDNFWVYTFKKEAARDGG